MKCAEASSFWRWFKYKRTTIYLVVVTTATFVLQVLEWHRG